MLQASFIASGIALLLSGSLVARAESDKAAFGDRLLWGECQLPKDPFGESGETVWPVVCIKGRTSYQALSRSEMHERNGMFAYGEGYIGLHLTELVSVHAKGRQMRLMLIEAEETRETETLFLQLGNATLSRWRLSVGRVALPFGIQQRPLLELYDEIYKTDKFWAHDPYGFRLAVEDFTTTQLDIGVTGTRDYWEQQNDGPKIPDTGELQVSARLMIDIAALGGTRFVISGMDERPIARRLSAGLITRDPSGGQSTFEWVRRLPRHRAGAQPFEQLIRFNYIGNQRKPSSWLFEYEDEFEKHWLTTIGFEQRITEYGRLRLNVSYYKARTSLDVNHWLLVSGLQVNL